MTRQDILKELNRLTLRYNLTWDDIKVDADSAIHQINTTLSCDYPDITTKLVNDSATYTYRDARGNDVPIIKDVYFYTIVFPFIAMEILARDEEFTTVYQKYQQDFTKGKFEMFSNEFNYVPDRFKRARSEGVFFPSNNRANNARVTPANIGSTSATNGHGMSRRDILNELTRRTLRYTLTWDDVKADADKAIHQINTALSCAFPSISSILVNDEATYTYKDSQGINVPIIKDAYFHSVVFPFMSMEILARDEEFTTVYQKYQQDFAKGKFEMFSNELNYIPERFKRPRAEGVFFPAKNKVSTLRGAAPTSGYVGVETPEDIGAGGGASNILPSRTHIMIDALNKVTEDHERRITETEDYKDLFAFNTEDDFPEVGVENKIYLAKIRNAAYDDEEPRWEDYNMMFRYDTVNAKYIPIAGQGSGGGYGDDVSKVKVIPFPKGSPTTINVAQGTAVSIGYTYTNNIYPDGTRNIFVNDTLVSTALKTVGDHTEDMTPYLSLGLNTIKIVITDAESATGRVVISVNVDTITFSSTFNDAVVYHDRPITIPYKTMSSATVRELYVTIDGVEKHPRVLSSATGTETISGLTYGAHAFEMYVVGKWLNDAGVELYNITSNVIKYTLIYTDDTSTALIIASNFRVTTAMQGTQLSIDYIVYDRVIELNEVNLHIDDDIVNTLTVDSSRQYWSLKSLSPGTHVLKIQSGEVSIERTIEITPLETELDIVKDDFLKLYLTAYGKNNSDLNKNVWTNSYGAPVEVQLNNLNFTSDGWINDALRLSTQSSATISYKPFLSEVTDAGKTIELSFRTRYVFDSRVVLISCLANNIGFEITSQHIRLLGSNVTAVANFKEDDLMNVSFVINPVESMIATYINGVISGAGYYTDETTFRQLEPANIKLNPNKQSVDVHSIKVYDRALSQQEILSNYLADLTDTEEKIDLYTFNDIYNTFGNPDKEKISTKIPVMMIEGSALPVAKVKPRPIVRVTFEHPFEPAKNFVREGVEIDVQGTSSLQYPIKNFKLRLPKTELYEMEPGMIPERVFTLKADYMDSSHSNNTGMMKLFDTIYDEGNPPKLYDDRVRTTLYGYPMVLFHRVNAGDPWVFKGVYNFNLDKDAETSVGLDNERQWEAGNPASVMPLTQSFEITFNADSGAGAFQDDSLEGMISSFEPRYPEVDEFDLFEDLSITAQEMLIQAKGYLVSNTTDESIRQQVNTSDATSIVDIYDNLFVVPPHEFIEAFRVLRGHYSNLKDALTWVMENNDKANFKTEFDAHFNKDSAFKYLISTLIFGLVDNLGKNTMMNTWDGTIWHFNFYDIDTAMGLENQGRNIHEYDIEIGDANAYATADSWLWANILRFFKTDLDVVYSGLRQSIYTYENILDFFYTQQISKIPQAVYNEDSYAKYIGITTAWLWMAQGTRLAHIRRWLQLRLAFLDSKFLFGNYLDKAIALRMNVDGYTNAYLELRPLISQYVGVRFGNIAGGIVQKRTNAYSPVHIQGPEGLGEGQITNMEVWVYGAEWLSSIGDITHLNVSSISVDNAPKLTELVVGGESITNNKLTQVSIGSNTYLETVDVTNCTILGTNAGVGSTEVLNVAGAENVKTILAQGTQLKGVSIKPGAAIETLKLPATITQLVLRDHVNLKPEGLVVAGYTNVTTLRLENLPNIDVLDILSKCTKVERVRILGANYSYYGPDKLLELVDLLYDDVEGFKVFGIDANGNTADKPVIGGMVKVLSPTPISPEIIAKIKTVMPNINLQVVISTPGIQFMEQDGCITAIAYIGFDTVVTIPAELNPLLTESNPVILSNSGWKPVTRIARRAFLGKLITRIAIPQTVTDIGEEAFANAVKLSVVYLPSTVVTLGVGVFKNTGADLIIMTSHESKPEGWHEDWNSSNRLVVWSVRDTNTRFVFDTKEGTAVPDVDAVYLETLPTPTKRGWMCAGWTVEGTSVTTPYFPDFDAPYVITLEVVWEPMVYNVEFNIPDGTTHITKQVPYGEPLGELPIDAVYGELTLYGWDHQGTILTPEYIIDQDEKTFIIIGLFVDVSKIRFAYVSDSNVYDVTGFDLYSSTPELFDIIIPTSFNDGINGFAEVRNIKTPTNYGYSYNLGSLRILENTQTGRTLSLWLGGLGGYENLTTVVVPEGFTDLGNGAFRNCPSLTSVSLPSTLTSIGKLTFSGCISLTSITIPTYVTSIGASAFSGCTALTSVNILGPITSIATLAFQYCSALTTITIPDTVTSIGNSAFRGCTSLLEIILLRDNVPLNLVNNGQFYGTHAAFILSANQNIIRLTSDTMGILSYDGNTLYHYGGYRPEEVLSTVKNIAKGAFSYNDTLTNLDIPNSVTSIDNEAFQYCSALTTITIPDTVTSIATYTFSGCTALTSINFLGSITNISGGAFQYCSALTTITIPDTVTSIYDYAFEGCTSLTSITIPTSITSIGNYAFRDCTVLASINILGPVTKIGTGTFQSCKALTTITIPNSVVTVGVQAFYDCTALTTITIPDTVTSIGNSAFSSCTALITVILKSDVPPTLGGSSVFSGSVVGRKFYIPIGSYTAYSVATNWVKYKDSMEEVEM